MIQTIRFKNSQAYYGESAKEQLAKWSETISKSQVISITMQEEVITVFYWES